MFLFTGKYLSLTNALLGIAFLPISSESNQSLLIRRCASIDENELLWSKSMELLLTLHRSRSVQKASRVLLGALNSLNATGSSRFSAAATATSKTGAEDSQADFASLPRRLCAIAVSELNETPGMDVNDCILLLPYQTNCGCLYSYVNITRKLTDNPDGWRCLRCSEIVNKARPWSGHLPNKVDTKQD